MATKQERIPRQNALLAVHDKAKAKLMSIPGVIPGGRLMFRSETQWQHSLKL
jgi:hypothetical protein